MGAKIGLRGPQDDDGLDLAREAEKNSNPPAGSPSKLRASRRYGHKNKKRAAPPRAARLGGRAPTYNLALPKLVATPAAEHRPAAGRPNHGDDRYPASPCSRKAPGRARPLAPYG